MKKNHTPETGLFNARLVLAVSLCFIGISLSFVSFASTPSAGTLTTANTSQNPLTFTAGPFFQPNAFGNSIAGECDPDPSDPLVPCTIYRLRVSLPPSYVHANPNTHLFVRIDWSVPAAVFDLYLWDAANWAGVTSFPNGSPIAQ